LADELEARLQKKTRHELKAERIREAKGKVSRPRVTERLNQFALRPLNPNGQQYAPRQLGKLLAQFEYLGHEEIP
jgi:hypothetical protein